MILFGIVYLAVCGPGDAVLGSPSEREDSQNQLELSYGKLE